MRLFAQQDFERERFLPHECIYRYYPIEKSSCECSLWAALAH
jgi:hypothetical protein